MLLAMLSKIRINLRNAFHGSQTGHRLQKELDSPCKASIIKLLLLIKIFDVTRDNF